MFSTFTKRLSLISGYVPDEEIVVDEITSAEEDQVEAGNEEIRLQPEVESMDEDPDPEVELRNTQIESAEEELEPEGLNPEIESSDVEDRGHDGASADEEDSNEEEGTNLKGDFSLFSPFLFIKQNYTNNFFLSMLKFT